MKTTIKIFTEAANEKNASVVMNKCRKQLKLETLSECCEPYHKGGYVCRFEAEVPATDWETIPYRLLSLCQRLGYGWQLSGDIEHEFDAWSNDASVVGGNSIHVLCSRLS